MVEDEHLAGMIIDWFWNFQWFLGFLSCLGRWKTRYFRVFGEMGLADGSNGKPVNSSVGSIVWVRRRNGSWWPGRILGLNELSATHLMSPRSGTPVKLLGREDASVDWYNLEKSKRVKAFRCGEFDDCIGRAESSQGMPAKKREKYARREDAILHALELEKQLLERNQQSAERIPGVSKRESAGNSRQAYNLGKGEKGSLPVNKFKQDDLRNWEDDNAEAMPRMRGLQDFGLKIASKKRKPALSPSLGGTRNANLAENHVSSSKSSPTSKRRRISGAQAEESLVKRRDRRRPLVQVLQSSAKLQMGEDLEGDGDDRPISLRGVKGQVEPTYLQSRSLEDDLACSRLIDEQDSDSCVRDYLNPDMDEDAAVLSDHHDTYALPRSRNKDKCVSQPGRDGGLDDTGIYMPHPFDNGANVAPDVTEYKWQWKGKRNLRNLPKKHMDAPDERATIETTDNCNGLRPSIDGLYGTVPSGHGFSPNDEKEPNYSYDRGDTFENEEQFRDLSTSLESLSDEDSQAISSPIHKGSRFSVDWAARASSDRRSWEEATEDIGIENYNLPGFKPDQLYETTDMLEPMLVEVDIKVQASYQGERVPLVSLMSRLNGKAIVGHPVQIEILEDGSSEHDRNEGRALPPVWRTGRRTAMHRVPRPQVRALSPLKKASSSQFKMRFMKRSLSNMCRSSMGKKSQKRLLKKVGFASQKTRTLSSISTEKKPKIENGDSSGLIKDIGASPSLSCIPVRVVFSRIKEALGGPAKVIDRDPS
ncbi:uncharacterized protein At1g51745 [Amborella trichopoda]|nr:uncharacterized protein At1g51745 [Amborella trichopoda]|eukprot:XP_006854154.2 uncharacterized protein At1g51745 [Amborella trichopoda]